MASSQLPGPPKIFLDASVLFAATLSKRGYAHDLIVAGARGGIELFVSTFVLIETRRNLARKASRALPELDGLLALAPARFSDPSPSLVQQVATEIALKDAPIVAGAIHSGAEFLATYDRKHLLARAALIEARFGIVVATPETIYTAVT